MSRKVFRSFFSHIILSNKRNFDEDLSKYMDHIWVQL